MKDSAQDSTKIRWGVVLARLIGMVIAITIGLQCWFSFQTMSGNDAKALLASFIGCGIGLLIDKVIEVSS